MQYYDREGRRITLATWRDLQAKTDYQQIREYDNGAVRLRLVWLGKLTDQQAQSFRDTWPLYTISVWNYNDQGKLVPDPVEDGKTFAHEGEAINAYEEFLINWTDSEVTDDGKLIEADNLLAPPPPPDPDRPATEFTLDEDNDAAW